MKSGGGSEPKRSGLSLASLRANLSASFSLLASISKSIFSSSYIRTTRTVKFFFLAIVPPLKIHGVDSALQILRRILGVDPLHRLDGVAEHARDLCHRHA